MMIDIALVSDLTPVILILSGIFGFLFAGERVLSKLPVIKVDTKDKGTMVLKWVSIIFSIVCGVWIILLNIHDADYHPLTLILLFIFMIVIVATPIREFEGWKLVLFFIPFILGSVVVFWLKGGKQFKIFGFQISLWAILLGLTILLLILFVLVFIVEETVIDPILFFIQFAPLVITISLLMIIHGLLLFIYQINGLAGLLPIF